jgi:integral membrane protein
MVLRYGFNLFLFAGATNTLTGETFALGLAQAEPSVIDGFNLSIAVLVAHGWLYVLYLIADFRLWSLMRWPFTKFVLIALGGVIPFLSIILERKIHREVEEELAAHPEAAKRY